MGLVSRPDWPRDHMVASCWRSEEEGRTAVSASQTQLTQRELAQRELAHSHSHPSPPTTPPMMAAGHLVTLAACRFIIKVALHLDRVNTMAGKFLLMICTISIVQLVRPRLSVYDGVEEVGRLYLDSEYNGQQNGTACTTTVVSIQWCRGGRKVIYGT